MEQGYDWLSFMAGAIVGAFLATLLSYRRRKRQSQLLMPPVPPPAVPPEIKAKLLKLRAEGRMIDAIKLVRERTGCDLKAAKQIVETLK
jgi:hypothetical protein